MKRRLLNLTAAISLLLCIATLVLWLRSYWREDAIFIYYDPLFGERDGLAASSEDGRIYCQYAMNGTTTTQPRLRIDYADATLVPLLTATTARHRLMGFAVGRGSAANKFYDMWVRLAIVVPHYALVLAFTALPGIRTWQFVRLRRTRDTSTCPTCGYDLRATPSRCPECGAVPAAK